MYYSCLHVFSKNNESETIEIGHFIEQNDVTVVYTTAETARRIYVDLPSEIKPRSTITEGWVSRINRVDKEPRGYAKLADQNDFVQIAELIYDDEEIGKLYKYDELLRQLVERNQEGFARNFVIKDNNLVIAHACTNAETSNIAIVGELLVRREYRRRGFASEIWRRICSELLSEGKEVFSFYYSEESRLLHKKSGFTKSVNGAKLLF